VHGIIVMQSRGEGRGESKTPRALNWINFRFSALAFLIEKENDFATVFVRLNGKFKFVSQPRGFSTSLITHRKPPRLPRPGREERKIAFPRHMRMSRSQAICCDIRLAAQ
jgi:hypothetical protein